MEGTQADVRARALRDANVARMRAAIAIAREVRSQREAGVSWQAIGDGLGITRQVAHKRFASLTEANPAVGLPKPRKGDRWLTLDQAATMLDLDPRVLDFVVNGPPWRLDSAGEKNYLESDLEAWATAPYVARNAR